MCFEENIGREYDECTSTKKMYGEIEIRQSDAWGLKA